ncbi:trimeric intracellular cation channel family protein [Arsenicicoccus cauae]|uniref:trimeric intracellular cation channel family protein n=1 Tax=Arsenicicoccus cauae TaxID=2663847 RepID=UPI00370DAA32
MLRDVVLDVRPVGLTDWRLVLAAVIAGLVAFGYAHVVQRLSKLVLTFDALGLATFAIAGTVKALSLDAPALESVLIGLMTAVGGGMVRDVLAGVVPEVLRTQLYAVPALAGSALLVALTSLDVTGPVPSIVCAGFVFAVRMAALRWHWSAPRSPRSLP